MTYAKCHPCNTALGGFKDSTDIIYKAIDYMNNPTWTNFTSAA